MTKNVLILGASSDIGLNLTEKFLINNYKVYAHYNKQNKNLKNLNKKFKTLKIFKSNLLNSSIVRKNLKNNFFSKFDIFVNLVGYTDNVSFEKFNEKNLINNLRVNFINPQLIMKKCIKNMIKKKWGRILNASSIGVKFGGGKTTYNYSFSKHANEFIPSVFKDWSNNNVLTNTLRIGVTDTKIHKNILNKNLKKRIELIPMRRMAKVKEITNFIYFLTTQENTYISGQILSISGGE